MVDYDYLLKFDANPKLNNGRYDCLRFYNSSVFKDVDRYKSLTRMVINRSLYKVYVFNEYKDKKGNPLKVYAPHVLFKKVQSMVRQFVDTAAGYKFKCFLYRHVDKNKCRLGRFDCYSDDYTMWWDYTDDFFCFFEGAKEVLDAMEDIRKTRTEIKMPTPASLKREYINRLQVAKNKYDNSTINTCNYDKLTKTYYIEFLDDADLEEAFMDAIVLAKTSGCTVEATKDGISHTITPDSVTDIIVSENGVDMVDSNTYSERIADLVTQHKNVLNESRIKLVQVLKYIRDNKEVK